MCKLKKLALILSVSFLNGCYVITDEDLFETYKPLIVIEAEITNLNQPYVVKISQSVNATDSLIANPITKALVAITDNKNNSEILKMTEPGTYVMTEIKGTPETEYSLSVNINQTNYSAMAVMPKQALIAKWEVQYIDKFVPQPGNYVKLYILKENTHTHYYKLEVSKNDSLLNSYTDLVIFDDAYADDTIEFFVPYAFMPNDIVTVDLHAISAEMYRYYYELRKQTNTTFRNIQPPMQNPPSNIQNEALGYFQASAVTRINLIIN